MDVCRSCRLLLSVLATQTGEVGRVGSHLSAFSPGDLVAKRYKVIRLIGAGGMGEVYEASDSELGERVALKTIAVGATLDDSGVARLKAEVQMARRVTHRNVCRVFDVGYHTEPSKARGEAEAVTIPFFTMELLPGETLGQLLRLQGPCPVSDALILIGQVASGLDAAHRSGVIHTDLKSDNIMLVPEGAGTRVVITDFGLAMRLDGRARWTGSGMSIAGTIGYMAPEQFGLGQTGRAADIYALGVILFELLTGRLPFTPQVLAASTRDGVPLPTPLLSGVSEIPNAWVPILERCLNSSPAARFDSAQQVIVALRSALQARSGGRFTRPALVAGVAVAVVAGASALLVGGRTHQASFADRLLASRPQLDSGIAQSAGPDLRPEAAVPDQRLALPSPDAAPLTKPASPRSVRPKRPARPTEPAHRQSEPTPSVVRQDPNPGDDDMIDPHGWR